MSILREILAAKRARVAELRRERSAAALADEPLFAESRRSLAQSLRRPAGQPVRFLCEIKRASPSSGEIRPGADAPRIAESYRGAGASGISLVTEERFFLGRPADLPAVRRAGLPVLMKDFFVDPWQVAQARSLGADALLLLAALGDRPLLQELRAAAREQGLETLVEIHDAGEIDLALRLDPEMLGVNHRDLRTFEVDLERGARLLPHLPPDRTRLAESGIRNRRDALRLEAAGFDALLVGESLMRAEDPAAALRALRGEATAPGNRAGSDRGGGPPASPGDRDTVEPGEGGAG